MWPQTLQMSDDDCRSTLRRLELETYASVVGVFRAQGGLSDKKVKLLEELRNIFHISQDRHRAEARRVANDEHLSTIAKVVSGPNTWQEWSREGRRSYPMLPRVAPQTALGWIANNLAAEAALENAKLPYPVDTAAAALEEQHALKAVSEAIEGANLRYPEKYVVTSDPFKLPDIPTVGAKKNLKRGINDSQQATHSNVAKKRNMNDAASPHKQKHITATSSTTSPTSGGNRRTISNTVLQQQRFFYQQQQKAKKLAKAASKREKLPGTGKLGRKPKKVKEQEQRQQREREQQQQFLQQQQQELGDGIYDHQLMQRIDHADYTLSTNIANVMIDMGNQVQSQQSQPIDVDSHYAVGNQKSHYMAMATPQIAASKRDITRNLTKLQIPAQASLSPTAQITKQSDVAVAMSSSQMQPVQKPSTILIGNKATTDLKLAPLSTPVQKYIVEDRQPQMTTAAVGALPPSLMGHQTTSQFIAGLPQAKLRPINTTILPAGTKLSTPVKKLTGAVLSPGDGSGGTSSPLLDSIIGGSANTSAQLYNLVEGTGLNQANISQQHQQPHLLSQPTAPTHTPPAVIQLHNNEVLRVGSTHPSPGGSGASSTQSKVLTTKILPIVLSSNSAKAEAAKNGGASIVSVSTGNFVTNSGATIIKSLPASLLVSAQHGTSGSVSASSVFSSFGSSGGPIYRKHPNILRSSSTTAARQLQNSSVKSGGPQIISNIRLTPAITSTAGVNSTLGGTSTQSSIFQQQLRSAPSTSTGIRTSVKICQSPNGKVFIQPANMSKLPSGHITQRLLPSTILGGSSGNVTSSGIGTLTNKPGSPRIAIQKVQIIPAPLSGTSFSTAVNASQQHNTQQRLAATTLTLGGGTGSKSSIGSNLFIQARNATAAAAVGNSMTLGTKSTASSSTSDTLGGIGTTANVVVIDAGKTLPHHTTKVTTSNLKRANIDSSQMITEDTPVDIIVDDSPAEAATVVNTTPANESSSITAVLASNFVTADQIDQAQSEQQKQTTLALPMAMLNATDWEMELDQAKAASSTHQHVSSDGLKQQHQHLSNQSEQLETADTIIIDDSFEDVIIEEEEQDDTTATESEQYDSEDQQHPHIDHQNDDDIIIQQCHTILNEQSKTAAQLAETNFESVPMCIEEPIETTHIAGGNRTRLSESDVDVSFSSSGHDNVNSNTDIVEAEIEDCIENENASQKSIITIDHQFTEKEKLLDELIEDSQECNNIDENTQAIISSSPTLKIEKITTLNNEAEDEDIMAIETTKTLETSTDITVKTTTPSSTTKVSASLLTVKDYDAADATLDTNENPKTNFDFTDEAKSNQSDAAALNAPATEQ